MKNSIRVYIVTVSLAVCCLVGIAAGQGSLGDTSISYDDATGTVTVYGETTNELDDTYAPSASVSVVDQNNVTVANGSDFELYNNASVGLSFTATPGSTYTAVSNHCFHLQYWSYDNVWPYHSYYYDDWGMTLFISQHIYSPADYYFESPGFSEVHRTTNSFCVGKTYDSVQAPPNIQSIQYKGPNNSAYSDVTGVLYVLKGTTVSFTAIPDSSSPTFPSGYPKWSGTSGATGAGTTTSVTFNTISSSSSDYKTVIATAGSSSATVNVVVYDLTGTLTPEDNFSGRSTDHYGLKELVDLSYTMTPNIATTTIGGLTWKVASGSGSLNNTTNGNDTFTAPGTAGTTSLKLEVQNGPSKGLGPQYSKTIVAPSDATMIQSTDLPILLHCHGYSSVGFYGEVYFSPKDVSFAKLFFREGGGTGVGHGFYSSLNGAPHPSTNFMSAMVVGSCNVTTGCKSTFIDNIYSGKGSSPFGLGDFTWPIAWLYALQNDVDPAVNGQTQFTTATHYMETNSTGTASIQKKGAGPFSRAVNDADENCPAD